MARVKTEKMARVKTEKAQSKTAAAEGSQVENQNENNEKTAKAKVTTTEGNTIDRIRVFQKDDATMVQVDYGKLNPDGKTPEEKRAGMRTQMSRQLTSEQAKTYQDLYAKDPVQAKEFAVKTAYPMHVDDAAFHQKNANINGRDVNYITIEKITEDTLLLNALRKDGVDVDHMNREQRANLIASMTPDAKDMAVKGSEGLVGKWQLAFGEKGNKESRFYGIMNAEDLASLRHRAEVTLDEKGQVKSVGKPMTMADIAGRMEQRVQAQRQTNGEKLDAAQKVDWSKFKLPSAANVTSLRYSAAKDNPDRVWLSGKVNGIECVSLLSVNETTAVKNRLATLEQVAAANRDFHKKALDIVGPGQKQEVNAKEDAAVKAIVDRASDSTARNFSPEQMKTLNDFAAGAETPDERAKVFDGLWEKAESQLKAAGVNDAWQKDAHNELKDLAEGIVRSEAQGLKR